MASTVDVLAIAIQVVAGNDNVLVDAALVTKEL